MQLTGGQFTLSTALAGNDLATFPDFPAEIRAPQGTTFGVSAFQIHFASRDILTPGDTPDVLVAMNPAALKANLGLMRRGATILVNEDAFSVRAVQKAGYTAAQLRHYRSGERKHELMTVVSQGLSDQQIADLAAWYAAIEMATGSSSTGG